MAEMRCRACWQDRGDVVLDLGNQPAADYFPAIDDPGPDPVYPLQMWLCSTCGLAQLLEDATVPDEPRGVEPFALITQAKAAMQHVADARWLRPGMSIAEFGSPHGGSWLPLAEQQGLVTAGKGSPADVVIDSFGLMHEPDQAAAISERADRVALGGVLLIQFHSLATIVSANQWNSLRHGHFAYYSLGALTALLASVDFAPCAAWRFDLYGGTVLLAAKRRADVVIDTASIAQVRGAEATLRLDDPTSYGGLQRSVSNAAAALRTWLVKQRSDDVSVMGYGAASRAVALLCSAMVYRELLPAVADASLAKHGRRMPGTNIPVVDPATLVNASPDSVLVLLSDLVAQVRADLPEVEANGGCWVDVAKLSGSDEG